MGSFLKLLCVVGVGVILLTLMPNGVFSAEKQPIPTEAALKAAQATVKELFKTDIAAAKTATQLTALADKMLEAVEGKPETAVHDYVLLTIALSLTEKASHIGASSSLVERIAAQFTVDGRELQLQAMKNLAKGPTDKVYHKELATRALQLAAETQRADRADLTKEYLELVDGIGRRLKTNEWSKTTSARRAEIAEHKKLIEGYATAENRLLTKPDDPAANDAAGRYWIGVKQDWERGLKMLALSPDAVINKAAKMDDAQLDAPKAATPEQAVAIGDAWWEAANIQSGASLKSGFKLRAGQWYSSVVEDLKGLAKTKAEQRATESGWDDDAELRNLMPLNRRDHQVTKSIRAGTGMFVPGKFVIVQTLPLTEAKQLDQTLKSFKMRSVRFRPYATAEGVKVAAIWLPSSVEGDLFEGTADEITKHDQGLRARGFYPQDLAGWIDGTGKDRHVLLSRVGKINDSEYVLVTINWRIAADNVLDIPKDAAAKTWQQYADASGQRYNDILWYGPKGTKYRIAGSRSYYERRLAEIGVTQKLIDVSVVASGKSLNYGAAFFGLSGFSVSEVHGLTPDQNLVEWQKLAAQGAHPNAIGVCVSSDGVLHSASVWHTPDKKK